MREKEQYYRHASGDPGEIRLDLRELWKYRDLVILLTVRSFTVSFKQTVLGPVWLFIRPVVASLIQMVIFGTIAGIGTGGVPRFLFYLSGNAAWSLFSATLSGCSDTFISNATILSKVYFPRLVMPVSTALSALAGYALKMLPAVLAFLFFLSRGEVVFNPLCPLLLPPAILELLLLGTGLGLIAASLTTGYRDLNIAIRQGSKLWMYVTPVIYPLSEVGGRLKEIMRWNPAAPPMELMRFALWRTGTLDPVSFIFSWIFTLGVLAAGLVLFGRVEKVFADTI